MIESVSFIYYKPLCYFITEFEDIKNGFKMASTMVANQTKIAAYTTSTGSHQNIDYVPFIENDEYLANENIGRVYVPVIFGLFMFLGLTGNSLVIFSFVSKKRMRTLTNILILNLAIGDIAFLALCIPFATFRFITDEWPYGDVGCKLSQYFVSVSVYVTVYTLVLMAVSRYFAIVHPLSSIRFRTKRNIIYAVIFVWIACISGNIPVLIQMKVYRLPTENGEASICENSEHLRNPTEAQIFYVVFSVLAYVFPLTVISILYGLILRRVFSVKDPSTTTDGSIQKAGSDRHDDVKKRVAKLILVVIATFAICWLPVHLCFLTRRFGIWATETTEETGTYISLLVAAKCLAYSNSCLNPILYTFLSSNFRKSFKEIVCCLKSKYAPSSS